MDLGRSGSRSRNGCWTCRTRKVKCDESRPICGNCISRNIHCDYVPRVKSQRRRRRPRPEAGNGASSSQTSQASPLSIILKGSVATSVTPSDANRPSPRLPGGLEAEKWPISLSGADCRAICHYVENIVPRMVLKTPQFSTYASILVLCTKHPLLTHLILAISVQDLSGGGDTELNIIAIGHYQEALTMFIKHLESSEKHLWLTFPALWLFITYEQQYGDDPQALQRHLEGVRDIVVSHGSALFPAATGNFTTVNVEGEEFPRQLLDRLALWTIYHDACASTFGFGGSLISLLQAEYPNAIGRIRESSEAMGGALWGEDYPAEEELWDLQISPLGDLYHDYLLLRHELSVTEDAQDNLKNERLINIGRELNRLEKEYSPFLEAALSGKVERTTVHSNMCCTTALFYSVVLCWERIVYGTRPTNAIFKILRACASLYEYEGIGFLCRAAWPMLVAGLETDDLIHQSWVLERFTSFQELGENMRRAKLLLETVYLEQRMTGRRVDYLARIRSGELQGFVI